MQKVPCKVLLCCLILGKSMEIIVERSYDVTEGGGCLQRPCLASAASLAAEPKGSTGRDLGFIFPLNTMKKFNFTSRIPVLPSGNTEQRERAGTSVAESQADETEIQEPEFSLCLHPQLSLHALKAKQRGCLRASCV